MSVFSFIDFRNRLSEQFVHRVTSQYTVVIMITKSKVPILDDKHKENPIKSVYRGQVAARMPVRSSVLLPALKLAFHMLQAVYGLTFRKAYF